MKKYFLIPSLILLVSWTSCNSQTGHKATDSLASGSDTLTDAKHKSIDYQKIEEDRPDSEQETPSQAWEIERLSKTYNQVRVIDTMLLIENDSLHLHLKYYCLKNIPLVIPKHYVFDEKSPKDFITHDFVSDIIITQKGYTIFKKTIRKNDFNSVITEQLRKYAILRMPDLSSSKTNKNQIVLNYSISIPATDIGTGVYLIIKKNGDYSVLSMENMR